MNSVAAVLATASLPSSFNIRVILPDGGKHHTESFKLGKAGWILCHSACHQRLWCGQARIMDGGPARLGSHRSIGISRICRASSMPS